MKREIYQLLFFFALISFSFANAQTPSIQWEETFGTPNDEQATCTQQTADGGYIMAGMTGKTHLKKIWMLVVYRMDFIFL